MSPGNNPPHAGRGAETTEDDRFHWGPFLGYMVVVMAIFVSGLTAIYHFSFDPVWAYVAGFAVSLPVDFARDLFTEVAG